MDDIESINSTIDRMRSFTPADPYILTIPQDVEPRYRHAYAYQQRQWRENTPFQENEHECLQYTTFFFHEPGKSIYTLRESRPLKMNGGDKTAVKGADGKLGVDKARTGSNTPKKKISLDAYKKKQSAATPVGTPLPASEQPTRRPASKAPIKGPVERVKEDEEILASMETATPEPRIDAPENKDAKRKREDDPTEVAEVQKKLKLNKASPAVIKREPPSNAVAEAAQSASDQVAKKSPMKPADSPPPSECEVAKTKELPPKLSPPPSQPPVKEKSLPPKLSPIRSLPPLPPRLSPTLPANIVETLKVRERGLTPEMPNAVRNLTPPRSDGKNVMLKKSPRNGFRANSSSPAVRSDAEDRSRVKVKASQVSDDSSDELAVAKVKKPVLGRPDVLVVKLRFKKGTRETVRRILKMRPNPARPTVSKDLPAVLRQSSTPSASDARHREQREAGAKGVAQKVGPVKSAHGQPKKAAEKLPSPNEHKRPRHGDSDVDEPPAKRVKAPAEVAEAKKEHPPSTPDKAALASSTNGHRLAATPSNMRKDLLSVSMKRERSSDSTVNTPSAQSQSSPPDSTAQANGNSKSTISNQPSNKTPQQAGWQAEQSRLQDIGRDLKRAAAAHLESAGGISTSPSKEQTLAAIKSLESLLVYLVAFTCADEAALAADPKQKPGTSTWRSMQPFFHFVKKSCEPFPELLGVACWLAVSFNSRILELATLGNVLSREHLVETQAAMLKAAREGELKLDVDATQAAFPKTWKGRTKGLGGDEKLDLQKGLKGAYGLPIGVQTSPIRAARAGWAMLNEWVEGRQGVKHEFKLSL